MSNAVSLYSYKPAEFTQPDGYREFNIDEMNDQQIGIMVNQCKTDAASERRQVFLIAGGAFLAGAGVVSIALVASQSVGALFIHVANLDLSGSYYL